MTNATAPGALESVRVVELGEGKALAYAGKLLRDLGAEVIKVEPPGGDGVREYGPFPDDERERERSGMFIYLNGGKGDARLDLDGDADRAALLQLLDDADVLLHSLSRREAESLALEYEDLTGLRPHLVVTAVTTWGHSGPYADWRGYPIQAMAGSGVMYRNGEVGREPLTMPLDGAELHHAGAHVASATALALLERDRTGRGQFVDLSVHEIVAVANDGVWGPRLVYQDRPQMDRGGRSFSTRNPWGVMHTADGGDFCVLCMNEPQWARQRELLGQPDWVQHPPFDQHEGLMWLEQEERDAFRERVEEWVAARTLDELWEAHVKHGLPSHPVMTVARLCESGQLAERDFFVEAPGPHPPLRVPGAPYLLSATPWRPPGPPPRLDEPSVTEWEGARAVEITPPRDAGDQPLSGVRVLDFTQVWAGPTLGRYLADFGADVVLVETTSRPRWMNGDPDPTQPFAWEWIYRNRRGITLDLKRPEGLEVVHRLVRDSDVVIDNFSPKAMPSLGLDYERLRAINPSVIAASMSGAGRTGPWSNLLTYGPSLSALYGLKSVNGYPEDGTVVEDNSELDPVAATYTAFATFAALYHHARTGEGQFIEVAQGETGMVGMAEAVIEWEWNHRALGPMGNIHPVLAPHGVYPCSGDDQWIAIACGSDEEWTALARAAGHDEWLADPCFDDAATRREHRVDLDRVIGEWSRAFEHYALARSLQEADVAAFPVLSTLPLLADPHLQARASHFRLHEDFPAAQLLDGNPWHLTASPPRLRRPAPAPGRDTREILEELGYSATEIDRLDGAGVLQ